MAPTNTGSKRWYQYTADKGDIFLMLLDTQVATAGNFTIMVEANALKPIINRSQRRIRPRYIYAASPGGMVTKFPLATVAQFTSLQGSMNFPVGDDDYLIISFHGEKRYVPNTVDISPDSAS